MSHKQTFINSCYELTAAYKSLTSKKTTLRDTKEDIQRLLPLNVPPVAVALLEQIEDCRRIADAAELIKQAVEETDAVIKKIEAGEQRPTLSIKRKKHVFVNPNAKAPQPEPKVESNQDGKLTLQKQRSSMDIDAMIKANNAKREPKREKNTGERAYDFLKQHFPIFRGCVPLPDKAFNKLVAHPLVVEAMVNGDFSKTALRVAVSAHTSLLKYCVQLLREDFRALDFDGVEVDYNTPIKPEHHARAKKSVAGINSRRKNGELTAGTTKEEKLFTNDHRKLAKRLSKVKSK